MTLKYHENPSCQDLFSWYSCVVVGGWEKVKSSGAIEPSIELDIEQKDF